MMIIATDNLNRETIADRLVVGAIPNDPVRHMEAEQFVEWLNSLGHAHDFGGSWYRLVEDNYRLSRGMADLV